MPTNFELGLHLMMFNLLTILLKIINSIGLKIHAVKATLPVLSPHLHLRLTHSTLQVMLFSVRFRFNFVVAITKTILKVNDCLVIVFECIRHHQSY